MKNNFINPQTGQKFYIPKFITMIRDGKLKYFVNGGELMDGGVPLVKLGEVSKSAVFTDEKKRI